MKKWAYYNDNDPNACAWIRELINEKLITDGEIDSRSICDVDPRELVQFRRVHMFAGIAGWEYALQLAGWPEDKPVWTGSCPCQPFSQAGKGLGDKDPRHLWPAFFNLIKECRPEHVFGEQVSSAAIVGASGSQKAMQGVRSREKIFSILQELKGGKSPHVQRMREGSGAGKEAQQPGIYANQICGVEKQEKGARPCECRQTQGKNIWNSVQHHARGYTEKNRQRRVRGDWHTVQPKQPSLLGRAITGPDYTKSGIHSGEHAGCTVCGQCDGEFVGNSEDHRGFAGDCEYQNASIQHIIREVRDGASKTIERCWLDGISADLEAENYTCGSVVLGAHSAGAPHIRQRLWWAAHSQWNQQPREESRNGSARRMGRVVEPVSWNEHWENALRRIRVVDDGLSYGVALCDGARNAIVPQVAAAFISSYLEILNEQPNTNL